MLKEYEIERIKKEYTKGTEIELIYIMYFLVFSGLGCGWGVFLGVLLGGCIGIVFMCLFQINHMNADITPDSSLHWEGGSDEQPAKRA